MLIGGIYIFGYGVASLVLVGLAWVRPHGRLHLISIFMAAILFILWVVVSFDSDKISGLEFYSLFGVFALLWINWFAIKRLVGTAHVA